jgi:hypothetical protein
MAEWRENQVPTPVDKPEHWTMYFDGSLKLNGGCRCLTGCPPWDIPKVVSFG